MEQERKQTSPAFDKMREFATKVNNQSPVNENGKREYYTSKLKMNEYDKKDGTHVKESTFSLYNHKHEEVRFTLAYSGAMKSATYIDWSDKNNPDKTFLAKNINKLEAVAKDPGLVEMAKLYDWSKSQSKEQDAEQEMEEAPIELD